MKALVVFSFVLASLSAWGASPSIERCATLGVAPGARTPSVFPVEGCPSVRPLPQSEKKVPASSIDRGDVKNALRSFFTVVVPSSLSSWAQGLEEEGTQRYALNAVRSYGDSAVQGLVSSLVEGLKASSPVFAHLEASYDYTFGSSASSWGAHVSGVFPLWRTKTNLLFSEINVLYKDKRPTLNIGIGDRYLLGKSVLVGGNAFYDEEFKDKNKRFSVGLEAGTLYLKGSANYYRRLSGWTHSSLSPAGTFYQERTANGYDVRLKGLLPFYPQVGLTARYFQWYGLHINLFAQNDVKQGSDDPRGIAVGVVYHPNQIFNVGVEYTKGLKNTQHATRVNAGVNFLFGVPLREQFAFSAPTLDLASQLFDPVNRENEIILEKRKGSHINLQSEYDIDVGGAPLPPFNLHSAKTRIIRPEVKGIKGALVWDFTLGSEFFKLARSTLQATFKVTDATKFGEHYRFRVSGQDIYGNPLSSSSFVVLKHIPFDSDGVILEVSKVQKQNATSFKIGVTAHEGDGRYTLDSTYGTKGLKVVRGGTSVTAWTLKPLTTGPITAGVKKEYTVTVPSPGLKGGATYTLSVRLVDGDGQKAQSADQSFKVTTTPTNTTPADPTARFASGRYVQPNRVHFVVEPIFQGLPQQGARPSWSLEKWNGTMWVKQPMWQTVHSADRDDVVKKDGPQTYTFQVSTSSPGDVDRLTLTLTPAVAAPAQLLSTSRSTPPAAGTPTFVVFTKGRGPTYTGRIRNLNATLKFKNGNDSDYHFTLKPSGGTNTYEIKTWTLMKGGTVVGKSTYTMTGSSLKPGTENNYTLHFQTPPKEKEAYTLQVTLKPTLPSGVPDLGDSFSSAPLFFETTAHLAWDAGTPQVMTFDIPDNEGTVPSQSFSVQVQGGKSPYSLSEALSGKGFSCLPDLSQNEKKFEVTCTYNATIPAGTNKAGQVTLQVTDGNGTTTQQETVHFKAWGLPKIDPHLIVKAVVSGTDEYNPDTVNAGPRSGAYIMRLNDALKITASPTQGEKPFIYHWTWKGTTLQETMGGPEVTKTLRTATPPGQTPFTMSIQVEDAWRRKSAKKEVKVVVVGPKIDRNRAAELFVTRTFAGSLRCYPTGPQPYNVYLDNNAKYIQHLQEGMLLGSPSKARGCLLILLSSPSISPVSLETPLRETWYLLKDVGGSKKVLVGKKFNKKYVIWKYTKGDPATYEMYQTNGERAHWTFFVVRHFYHNRLPDLQPKQVNASRSLGQICYRLKGTKQPAPALCGASTKTYSESEVRTAFHSVLGGP